MVINSRSGSHRVLLRRQLQGDPGEAGAKPGEDEEDRPGIGGRNGDEEEDVEEEEVEDLFGQIGAELVSGATSGGGGGGVGGGGRDDWGDDATMALLQAWGDKCGALNKWQLRLEDWGEVAAAVRRRSLCPKTDVQCKNRVDTLKKKFKVERQRQCAMGLPSKWNFYQILDRLLAMAAANAAANAAASAAARSPSLPVGADAGSIILRSENGSGKRQRIQEEDEEEAEEQGGDEVDDNDDLSDEHEELGEKGGGGEDSNESDQEGGGEEELRRRNKRKRRYSSSPLADAIAKLGEIFERMEECKRQQLLDLEKIRMQFAKDLELHRMQLLLQTQRELAKLHHGIQ